MFEEKHSYLRYSKPLHFLFKENKYVQKFCSSSNKSFKDFLFILIFFVTLSISNKKFSIIHGARKYNNLPPILVNINCDAITPLYQNVLNFLSEIDITLKRDIKPSNVLNAIKEDKTVVFLDIENEKRFNIVKLFTNYDENSKKCSNKLTSFGHFEKSQAKRHYSIGIYNNDRLKDYVSKNKTLGRNFTKSWLFNFNSFDDTFDSNYDEEAIKKFFIEVNNLIKNNKIIEYDISQEEFYIDDFNKEISVKHLMDDFSKKISVKHLMDDFSKKTRVKHLNEKKSYMNLFSSCIIFISIYNTIVDKRSLLVDKTVLYDAVELADYIADMLLESQKYFGDLIQKFKKSIIKRLKEPKLYTYVTEREIFKFVNQARTNRDASLALEELIDEKIFVEIIPLVHGKRKGPHGRMFLVRHSNIPCEYS